MKQTILFLTMGFTVTLSYAQVKPAAKSTVKTPEKSTGTVVVFKSAVDSASYALGMRIAQNLKAQGLDPLNMQIFQKGMQDALQSKKPLIADGILDGCIGNYQQKINKSKSSTARKAGEAFLAANGKRAGVISLPSGMQYEIIKNGSDTLKPKLSNKVKCHYHGTLMNGAIFDSSVDRGEPISFPLGNVIVGWQEALQLMTIGSKWKLYIPADLAYGDQQKGDLIVPGSLLIFEVELLGIE